MLHKIDHKILVRNILHGHIHSYPIWCSFNFIFFLPQIKHQSIFIFFLSNFSHPSVRLVIRILVELFQKLFKFKTLLSCNELLVRIFDISSSLVNSSFFVFQKWGLEFWEINESEQKVHYVFVDSLVVFLIVFKGFIEMVNLLFRMSVSFIFESNINKLFHQEHIVLVNIGVLKLVLFIFIEDVHFLLVELLLALSKFTTCRNFNDWVEDSIIFLSSAFHIFFSFLF